MQNQTTIKNKIEFSVAIFYDGHGNVLVQKRGSGARNSEKYALWGGAVEENETGDTAIKRELKEELGFVPTDLKKIGDYEFEVSEGKYLGKNILYHAYLSPFFAGWEDWKVYEGERAAKFKISEILDNSKFFKGDRDLFTKLVEDKVLSLE